MAKSRVKSDAEYQEILGLDTKKPEEKKVTHDASQYFDELRGTKKTSSDNPFSRVISVSELKENIKQNNPKYNVENIKEEIAKNQALSTSKNSTVEEPIDREQVIPIETLPTNDQKPKGSFSFEQNSRKLYDNLREKTIKVSDQDSKVPTLNQSDDIEIIEPANQKSSTSNVQTKEVQPVQPVEVETQEIEEKESFIPETKPSQLQQTFDDIHEDSDHEAVDITDFTRENENFLAQIRDNISQRQNNYENPALDKTQELETIKEDELENTQALDLDEKAEEETLYEQAVEEVEHEPEQEQLEQPSLEDTLMFSKFFKQTPSEDEVENIEETQQPELQQDENDEIELANTQDLFNHLNQQMQTLDSEADYDQELEEVEEHKNVEVKKFKEPNQALNLDDFGTNPSLNDNLIDHLNENEKHDRLSNTLNLALGPNDEEASQTKTLDLSDLEKRTQKSKQRSTIDIVINILLVVMIVVIFFLLYKSFNG